MKVVVIPIGATRHDDLLSRLQTSIVESLRARGVETAVHSDDSDLEGATHLLLPGVGTWGSPRLEETLRRAANSGITRVLWQMETLPPPDLPASLLTRLLLRPAPHRAKGLSRSLDSLLLRQLARTRDALNPGQAGEISAEALRLPIREARYIKRLWQHRLLDNIIVSIATRQRFLANMEIPSTFMPFGYFVDAAPPPSGQEKSIDVLYIGSRAPRRERLLSHLKTGLAELGYDMQIVQSGLYGEERDATIARSKIFLHLRNYPWELPRLRLMMAIAGDSLYVTEAFHDTHPFIDRKHFVMAPPDELLQTLVAHLEDDARRQRIVSEARAFALGELELGALLQPALQATPAL